MLHNKRNSWKYIWFIYIGAIAIYLFSAVRMSVPVHLEVDEELYLAMAKSFHETGSFQKGYEYINYSCVLYPMLISLGYYFYRPETIMITLRMINVIVMCSAVFPVYLLSKKILTGKKAILIAVFSMLIPDMIDSVYLMQEVFLYPVLMWCFYFIYMDFEKGIFYKNKYIGIDRSIYAGRYIREERQKKDYKKHMCSRHMDFCSIVRSNWNLDFKRRTGKQSLCFTDSAFISNHSGNRDSWN